MTFFVKKNNFFLISLFILLFIFHISDLFTKDWILLQSTTSTKNSGFYDYILPFFEVDSGIKVKVVAVGSGAAIRNIKNCDGDVLIAHSPIMEKELLSSGYSKLSYQFMFNDFVILGPISDPAKIKGIEEPLKAIKNIFLKKSYFFSRGDNSGTHLKEKHLWKKIGLDPQKYSGDWYMETGTSMGATINTAVGYGGYTLSDRATWINFENKLDFSILVQGGNLLYNPYTIIAVNNKKCPTSNFKKSKAFIDWIISRRGQNLIDSFKVNGKQLFFPSLKKKI